MNQQLVFPHRKKSKLGEIIDRQHVQIRHELQELRSAILEGADLERTLEIATDLILTMLLHFESEERAMGDNPDPRLAMHRQLHADLVESLKAISIDIEHRKIEGALELLKLSEGRLSYHLDVEDAEMERILAD
jgi:hemerythrin-like metal-binding protein